MGAIVRASGSRDETRWTQAHTHFRDALALRGGRYHARRSIRVRRVGAMGDQTESFGELLRQYRVEAGLTQEALAERAGLSRRGIADLERGVRRRPYKDTLARLADGLQLES